MQSNAKIIILSILFSLWNGVNWEIFEHSQIYSWCCMIISPSFMGVFRIPFIVVSIAASLICYYHFIYKKGESSYSAVIQAIGGNIIFITQLKIRSLFPMEGHYSQIVFFIILVLIIGPIITNLLCSLISFIV